MIYAEGGWPGAAVTGGVCAMTTALCRTGVYGRIGSGNDHAATPCGRNQIVCDGYFGHGVDSGCPSGYDGNVTMHRSQMKGM